MGFLERHNKRMRWEFLPVVLLLAILFIKSISAADEKPDENISASLSETELTDDSGSEAEAGREERAEESEIQIESGISKRSAGKEIYVAGGAVADGTGTFDNPFSNMEEALEESEAGSTIWIIGSIWVYSGEHKKWSIDPEEKPDVVIKRHPNVTGHLIYVTEGTLEIENLVFDGNGTEVTARGSILNCTRATISIDGGAYRNNRFTGISTGVNVHGGAIYLYDCRSVKINQAEITDNSVLTANGNANTGCLGGGVYIEAETVSTDKEQINITDSKISRNMSSGSGGGIYFSQEMHVKINGGEVSNNTAAISGGGLYRYYRVMSNSETYQSFHMNGTHMKENRAGFDGGAIWSISVVLLRLTDIKFEDNMAYKGYFWTLNPGGDQYSNYHSLYVSNCTYSQGVIDEEQNIYAAYTNAYNNYDVSLVPAADPAEGVVDITKTILTGGKDGVIEAEEELTYQIKYKAKNFMGILSDVYVEDILPDGVELINCSGGYSLYDASDNTTSVMADAKSVKWELGNLAGSASGEFTVTVKVLEKAGGKTITNKAGIIAEKEYQKKWDEVSIEVEAVEVIEFTVPEKFEFGDARIESKKQYFGLDWQDSADKESGKNLIAVEDTRKDSAADWSLYASLSGKVRDQDGAGSNILNDVLVYCESGQEIPLTDSNFLIADKSGYSGEYNWISEDWYEDYKDQGQYPTDGNGAKGLYLVLQPGQGSVNGGGSYKGEITWVFAYTP